MAKTAIILLKEYSSGYVAQAFKYTDDTTDATLPQAGAKGDWGKFEEIANLLKQGDVRGNAPYSDERGDTATDSADLASKVSAWINAKM
jgi:hypothetical protein